MKDIQGVLGQIQDRFVLSEFLTNALHSKSKKSLPTLANQLTKESYQAWQTWQTLQQRYLNLEVRKGFHLAILEPTWKNISNGNSEQELTFIAQNKASN